MESLKEIEQLIETLSGKYNAIKAEQNKVREEKEKALADYRELFVEYEKVCKEKEDMQRVIDSLRLKGEEAETRLQQIKKSIMDKINAEQTEG